MLPNFFSSLEKYWGNWFDYIVLINECSPDKHKRVYKTTTKKIICIFK